MKLKDLEFTELLEQNQIIGGIDENKVNVNLDLYLDIDLGTELSTVPIEDVTTIENHPRTVVEAYVPLGPISPDSLLARLLIASYE